MELPQALRFARCLNANSNFTSVMVEESRQAKHASVRFLVAFQPSNSERVQDILRSQQDARIERALSEAADYIWVPENGFHLLQSASGETYEVCEAGCTCRDFEERCRNNGLNCKHQIALSLGLGYFAEWRPVVPQAPAPAVTDAAAERAARMARDFPDY
jgi:hypothetical protein